MPATKPILLLLTLSLFGPLLALADDPWRWVYKATVPMWDNSPRRKSNFNNLWTLGYYHNRRKGTPNIIRMETTLEVPPFPTLDAATEGALGFWPGLESSHGEIVQSVVAHWVQDPPLVRLGSTAEKFHFKGNDSNWCFFPNYFREEAHLPTTNQQTGLIGLVREGQNVSIKYFWVGDESRYYQRMAVDGEGEIELPSTLVHGPLSLFAPRIEANSGFRGPIPAHRYHNTTIWLDRADPNFHHTLQAPHNAGMSSPVLSIDGGWVWHVGRIELRATESGELRDFGMVRRRRMMVESIW